MTGTLKALLSLVPVPRGRLAGAAVLGALTVLFGVGLMATAGYLISRAAERPEILSLMVVIVAVQFFGVGRPGSQPGLQAADDEARFFGRLADGFGPLFRFIFRIFARCHCASFPVSPKPIIPRHTRLSD